MIKKIKQSPLDKQYLALKTYTATPINVDFKTMVVAKPWGHEYLIFSTPEVEVWNLFIKNQRSTSMHCHPKKTTALIVLEGRALFSSLNESYELMPLDTMVIDNGVFHSTQCLSKEGLRLLELETPPMKHDLVRLEDKYGRAQKGYETLENMVTDHDRVRFFDTVNGLTKNVSENELCIKKINNYKDISMPNDTSRTLVALLSGSISSELGETLYLPPSVLTSEELQNNSFVFNNVSALVIRRP